GRPIAGGDRDAAGAWAARRSLAGPGPPFRETPPGWRGQGLCRVGSPRACDASTDLADHESVAAGPGHPGGNPVPAADRARTGCPQHARPPADRRGAGVEEATNALDGATPFRPMILNSEPLYTTDLASEPARGFIGKQSPEPQPPLPGE